MYYKLANTYNASLISIAQSSHIYNTMCNQPLTGQCPKILCVDRLGLFFVNILKQLFFEKCRNNCSKLLLQ